MDSARATPPAGAEILFAGKNLDAWVGVDGGLPRWKVEVGLLEVAPGAGDIRTRRSFDDFYLHLEFRCPHKPQARGQERGNSGVYLQGRYEIQILDSYGVQHPDPRDCGAVYGLAAPLAAAFRPPMVWQTLEVIFRSARADEPARLTALLNRQVIHNNLALPHPTPGSLDEDIFGPGPLLLQDHGDTVAFRHIWVVPLGSERSLGK